MCGERVVGLNMGELFRRDRSLDIFRMGIVFGNLRRMNADAVGYVFEAFQRDAAENRTMFEIRRFRARGSELFGGETGNVPILHAGDRRRLLNPGHAFPIVQYRGVRGERRVQQRRPVRLFRGNFGNERRRGVRRLLHLDVRRFERRNDRFLFQSERGVREWEVDGHCGLKMLSKNFGVYDAMSVRCRAMMNVFAYWNPMFYPPLATPGLLRA